MKKIKESYRGFNYEIIDNGAYCCVYVDISNTSLDGWNYSEIGIDCHGGLTAGNDDIIGWDYAHPGDMIATDENPTGKYWSYDEIVDECRHVIDQIIALTA